MRMNPLQSAVRAVRLAMSGRLHCPRDNIGAGFTDDFGQRFTVFREVVVDCVDDQPQCTAVLIAQFHLARMSTRTNIWFSLLPIVFIVGLPGFRSKQWLVDDIPRNRENPGRVQRRPCRALRGKKGTERLTPRSPRHVWRAWRDPNSQPSDPYL